MDGAAAAGRDLAGIAAAAIRGGADVIQLRHKSASETHMRASAERLLALTRPARIPLIINDHPAVAAQVGADGVHLGQDDLPLAEARKLLPPGAILGKSTHSLAQAIAAEKEGADYIGVGPIFATPTKPAYSQVGLSLIGQVRASVRVPFVCIGGIDAENLKDVLAAGGRCVAVVRAVSGAGDPTAAAAALKAQLDAAAKHPNFSTEQRGG